MSRRVERPLGRTCLPAHDLTTEEEIPDGPWNSKHHQWNFNEQTNTSAYCRQSDKHVYQASYLEITAPFWRDLRGIGGLNNEFRHV